MDNLDIKNKFEELYQKESDSVFRYCVFRVSSRSQAIDIVQDCFIELWQTYQKGEEIKNARALLFTILRNRIIDWYRKKKSSSLDLLMAKKDGEHAFEPVDEKAYDNIVFSVETRNVIEAINTLAPNYRDVVYWRLIEDRTPEEIGVMISANANTASIRINRGLEKLRKKLNIKE
jgi:RNA polymerase sigma-70 factor (ECF subfamily)